MTSFPSLLRSETYRSESNDMTIEEFWNQAFLTSLARVDPEQAKLDADRAVQIAISHWQEHIYSWGPSITPRWQHQNICAVPKTYGAAPDSSSGDNDSHGV